MLGCLPLCTMHICYMRAALLVLLVIVCAVMLVIVCAVMLVKVCAVMLVMLVMQAHPTLGRDHDSREDGKDTSPA